MSGPAPGVYREGQVGPRDLGDGLRARVEELERENAALRAQVQELAARCDCGERGRHARLHDLTCPVWTTWDQAHPPSRGDP